MADVALTVQQHVELLLALCTEVWQSLPQIATEINQWDLIDQLRFTEEWPLQEQRLRMLAEYVAEGALTPDQLARYQALQPLVAENRPIVDRILEK
jgi:hypothetical protein